MIVGDTPKVKIEYTMKNDVVSCGLHNKKTYQRIKRMTIMIKYKPMIQLKGVIKL
jgi:hypothetical protein